MQMVSSGQLCGKSVEQWHCSIKGQLYAQRLQDRRKLVTFGTKGRPVWLVKTESILELWNEMRLSKSSELRK